MLAVLRAFLSDILDVDIRKDTAGRRFSILPTLLSLSSYFGGRILSISHPRHPRMPWSFAAARTKNVVQDAVMIWNH